MGTVWLSLAAGTALAAGVAADMPGSNASPPRTLALRRPLSLAEASWTYQAPEEPKKLELNDVVVVLVDEKTQVISEGEMDRRRKTDGTFLLKDWIMLDGLNLQPDPQTEGEPAITGEMQGKFRSEAELQTRDSIQFRIACRVVDLRPNGNLIVEGHRSIRNNDDLWEMELIGEIRPDDVLPNNTVLSENVADIVIVKRETGHVRDGWRRGWFTKFFDRLQPF
jgi:flagellar L-ring protein precursor FlgH